MSVFSNRLRTEPAKFIYVNRMNPLGNTVGDSVDVDIIVVESGADSISSPVMQHGSDVLIYAEPDFPRNCVGGQIHTCSGRDFRVDGWSVGKNHRTGTVEHIELKCSEQI